MYRIPKQFELHLRTFKMQISLKMLFAIFILIAFYAGCGTVVRHLVERSDQKEPRNPDTGIMLGAEERFFGDPKSQTAVLFVHGFVGGGNNFASLPQRFADEGYFVRVMRLPGHGTSPLDFDERTADELIQSVKDEIANLRIRYNQIVLVGHSMGCSLGLITAAQTKVDALVMGAPYFAVTYKWYYILPPKAWLTALNPFIDWLYKGETFVQVNRKEVKDEILSYNWIPVNGIKTLHELGNRAKTEELLEAIHCPVLILHAKDDDAASPTASYEAFQKIASAEKRFVWLTRSNHAIYWDYEQEVVMQEALEFVRNQTQTATEHP